MAGSTEAKSLSVSVALLRARIDQAIVTNGGWLSFERFMEFALYAPGLGYYMRDGRQFGLMPESGSDFVTAPELSPIFGRALAVQIEQAMRETGTDELWEFGAGSGALAEVLLSALGEKVRCYSIIDLSGALRERQRKRLVEYGARVRWLSALPEQMQGIVIGNEVIDAMPVQMLRWDGCRWLERGVAVQNDGYTWEDRPTQQCPDVEGPHEQRFAPGSLTEIHPQAEAFVATLAKHVTRGAVFLIDYGFPASEYYHSQRVEGTLMCHYAHLADSDPLSEVGCKDLTAHVNFSGLALAAQNAGFEVLGYTSQARFLLNCGVAQQLQALTVEQRTNALRLLHEHEMGELFKVIGFARGGSFLAAGFARGDRTHTL